MNGADYIIEKQNGRSWTLLLVLFMAGKMDNKKMTINHVYEIILSDLCCTLNDYHGTTHSFARCIQKSGWKVEGRLRQKNSGC